MRVLGIESSCDELAMAILESDGQSLRASVVHSQIATHAKYGGVVPELASRDHVKRLDQVFHQVMLEADLKPEAIDAIAVTEGPGLIGSLLCGTEFAKGLALALGIPFLGIHHLEGHLVAASLEDPAPETPFVALLVSGGHTSLIEVKALGGPYRLLGQTRDDAAGEAFDKTAKLLGLPYPGGVCIDKLAKTGDARRFQFPQPMPGKTNLDFSFSGMKTAASREIQAFSGPLEGQDLADFCASFQEAIVDNLLKKAFRAVKSTQNTRLVIGGGVAANSRLRDKALYRGKRERIQVFLPSRANCTDNAAMIAKAGWIRLTRGERSDLELVARSNWPLVLRAS